MEELIDYDNLHKLDKSIPLVPGTIPPNENERIMAYNKRKNNLK